MSAEPQFFATSADFRAWLEKHHAHATELWVGFHKRGSGVPSITWPESVDAALCFGWIDGVRKSLGETSYTIRFTARKQGSKWSSVNCGRVEALTREGQMHEAGLRAFALRTAEKSGVYAYEQRHIIQLNEQQEKLFRHHKKGWAFFQAQPNWYRKTSLWWVVSAKKEETRQKRLAELIDYSERGITIRQLTRPPKSKTGESG